MTTLGNIQQKQLKASPLASPHLGEPGVPEAVRPFILTSFLGAECIPLCTPTIPQQSHAKRPCEMLCIHLGC